MDLRQLQYFLQIAECRSLTQAASRIWISQPALSRQMRALEADLGVGLFERKARGIALTESGTLLRASARQLMQHVAALRETVGDTAGEPVGHVRLGMTPSLREILTSPVAAKFLFAFPKATLSIKEGTTREVRDALAQGDLDVALFSTVEPHDPLSCTPLLTEQLFAVGPPEPGQAPRAMTVREFCKQPIIQTPYPNSLRQIVDRAASKAGIKVSARVEVETVSLMIDLVRAGIGRAAFPYCAVREGLAAGKVSARPLKGLYISWVIGVSRERAMTRTALMLIGMIRDECATLIRQGIWKTAKLHG